MKKTFTVGYIRIVRGEMFTSHIAKTGVHEIKFVLWYTNISIDGSCVSI